MNPFGWRSAGRWAAWGWVPLGVLVAIPIPLFPAPLPERAMPIFWLLLFGAVLIAGHLARVSWPLSLLFLWAVLRTLTNGLIVPAQSALVGTVMLDVAQSRGLQLLLLCAMAGLAVVAARELPAWASRAVAWAFCLGALYEFTFGYLNLWRIYPWMRVFDAEQLGRPMGFLTHPNYWGSYMALSLPIVWSLVGLLPAVAIFGVIAASWSGGPVISASAVVAVAVWPRLGRRVKYALLAALSATVAVVMTVHEWRLSGRREVWEAAWPELIRYPLTGQGLGSWRIWAEHFNAKRGAFFATTQAHMEPYQLWFELGLLGLGLGALVGWQAWRAMRLVWSRDDAGSERWWQAGWLTLDRAWLAVLVAVGVNALGSSTFHLPGQAALALVAFARLDAAADLTSPPPMTMPRPRRLKRPRAVAGRI